LQNGKTVKRHVDNIKARHCTNPESITTPEQDDITFAPIPEFAPALEPTSTDDTTSSETLVLPRLTRNRRPPEDLMTLFRLMKLQDFRREGCSNLTNDRQLL